MNILILNWRDIKNPKAGGAEILTHELSKRLVKQGHSVTQFSSLFYGAKKNEVIEGVKIVRDGHPDLRRLFSSVHFKAIQYYRNGSFGKIDIVLDEVHGIPFFTPLYVKEKKVALICEYAGSLWDIAVAPPFNYLGKFVEKIYPFFYKNVSLITISKSSKKELEQKLFKRNHFSIITPGCSTPTVLNPLKKSKNLSLIFIARLAKSKGVENAIETLKLICEFYPDVVLHIVGRGEANYLSELRNLVKGKKLEKNVIFHGFVSEKEKIRLIDKCHFLIIASEKEGWGLTVHEANARGVPAISYNVDGIRDVLKININGVLTKKNNPGCLAKETLTVFQDKKLYNLMAKQSILERKKYTWEKTTQEFISHLK